MIEMTLSDIQKVNLTILKDIHSFCKANGIQYSIAGGTLLGAVRHKGFIPWDDDVDIMMPRPEYERFCRLYKSDSFKLLTLENDKSCLISYARVCDMSRTLVEKQTWTKKKVGVWVDIFPFDGAEDRFELFEKDYSKMARIWRSSYRYRAFYAGVQDSNTKKMNVAISVVSFLHLLPLVQYFGKKRLKSLDALSRKIPFAESNHVSQYAFCAPGTKEYYEYKSFSEYIELPFEDTVVSAISGYSHYLERFYGDYMTLPKEEDRHPKQDYLSFIWR